MRFILTRDSFISGSTILAAADDIQAVVYVDASGLVAKAFAGKTQKPNWHYRFRSIEHRDEYVAEWFKSRRAYAAFKAEQKAARCKPHSLVVGDILCSTWGYDQTNVDFYEVVEVPGPRTVKVRAIGKSSVATEYMQGQCVPVPGSFKGDTMLKVVSGNGVNVDGHSASKIEPIAMAGGARVFAPHSFSSYA